MKPKTIVLMVVAVTCGLGASYMTSRLLAQRSQSETEEKITVFVASKPLDQGRMIKKPEEDFEAKEYLVGSEPKEAITKLDEIKGKVLKRSLRKGDWVSGGDLLSDKDAGIAALMAQGYRAVGVRINMASTASGFATLPLSRVDVYSTVRRGSDRDSFSQVLLENVLVLAVDTNIHRDPEGRAMPGNVVVLALKTEDALKIELAKELGPLSLALRKFNDSSKIDGDLKVTVEKLMTKTVGRDAESAEEYVEGTGQPPIAKTGLPALPKEAPKTAHIEVAEEPDYKVHRLYIIEGEHHKTVEFFLDAKGQVIPRDVTRSEVSTPPRPTPAPPAPTPAPATPAPPEAAPMGS
ncbi:MAG: Flp pilus assembly protein CpaB [Gemmataceae bacterium]